MRASTSHSLTRLCGLFDRNRQSYYEHGYRAAQAHQQSQEVEAMVVKKRQQMPRLGTRKLYYLLKADFEEKQIKVGRHRLFTILRAKSLLVGKVRKYTQTTHSRHWMHKYENLIEHLILERAEQVFVSDITYIATQQGFTYLSLVTDAYSKQILGYALRKDLSNSGTIAALQMALANRVYQQPLIHHSDRGLQYCSGAYVSILQAHQIQISMTQNGHPYENAVAERVNGILKEAFYLGEQFIDFDQALTHIQDSIRIYNQQRPHLSCQMLTPQQAHQGQPMQMKKEHKKALTLKPANAINSPQEITLFL